MPESSETNDLIVNDGTSYFNEDVHIFGKLYVNGIESLDDETTYGISGGGGSTHDHATENLSLGNLTVTGLTVNGSASITGTTTTEDMIVNDDLTVLDDASITGDLTAAKVSVTGGTSSGFLKADGTVDTNTYLTSSAAFSGFPQGTRMIFQQSTAPTGWTKDTTDTNQHALRVVSGTVSSGGSVDFTTAFSNRTISANISGNSGSENVSGNTNNENVSGNISHENVTINGTTQGRAISSSQMAQHSHVFPGDDQLANANGTGGWNDRRTGSWGYDAVSNLGGGGTIYRTSDSGNGHNHDHGISFNSGGHNHNFNSNSHSHNVSCGSHSHGDGNYSFNTTTDLRVKYLDVIICSKD